MEILGAESTNLFIGSDDEPRQVVRVRVRGSQPRDGRSPATLRIEGSRVRSETAVSLGPLAAREEARLEIGVVVDAPISAGETLPAEGGVEDGGRSGPLPSGPLRPRAGRA